MGGHLYLVDEKQQNTLHFQHKFIKEIALSNAYQMLKGKLLRRYLELQSKNMIKISIKYLPSST